MKREDRSHMSDATPISPPKKNKKIENFKNHDIVFVREREREKKKNEQRHGNKEKKDFFSQNKGAKANLDKG